MSIFQTGEEWQRFSYMFGLVEVIGEALFQWALQVYIIYIKYVGVRTFSRYQFVTTCSSAAMVFIHITKPLIPKKLRHDPEENIWFRLWFAIRRICWPIGLNADILLNFLTDFLLTYKIFYGTNMFIVLMSTQLFYLCICMLVICKTCLEPTRQTQLKFLLSGGMHLIWCAKCCYYVLGYFIKHQAAVQILPYEDAIFYSLMALENLIRSFLIFKSAFTLEHFSEFWDLDKVNSKVKIRSHFCNTILLILNLAKMFFLSITARTS